jgi:hypothetical protein
MFESDATPIIRFGRKQLTNKFIHMIFNEESTSKHHCSVKYKHNLNKWYIQDGDDLKKSLNGTWFLAENELIKTGMKMRVGTTTFEAVLSD